MVYCNVVFYTLHLPMAIRHTIKRTGFASGSSKGEACRLRDERHGRRAAEAAGLPAGDGLQPHGPRRHVQVTKRRDIRYQVKREILALCCYSPQGDRCALLQVSPRGRHRDGGVHQGRPRPRRAGQPPLRLRVPPERRLHQPPGMAFMNA